MNKNSGSDGTGGVGTRTGARSQRVLLGLGATVIALAFGGWAYYQLAPEFKHYFDERAAQKAASSVPARVAPVFPTAPVASKPPGVEASNAPEPVSLVLVSTQPGGNPRSGLATIGPSAEQALLIPTGSLLPNNSRLLEVYSDHVVLARRGAKVALYVGGARPAVVLGGDDRLSTRMETLHKVAFVGGIKNKPKEIAPDPGYAFATVVRTQPKFEQGIFKGIQLEEGNNPARFAALGFKRGDVMIALDGARIEDPAQAEDLLGALSSGGAVAVTVDRAGALVHLKVDPDARAAPPEMSSGDINAMPPLQPTARQSAPPPRGS
jgi:type II secretory pathway component PulC